MRFIYEFQPLMIFMDLTRDISNSLLQQSVKCMKELLSESVKYNNSHSWDYVKMDSYRNEI
jgi:hypothetical protein